MSKRRSFTDGAYHGARTETIRDQDSGLPPDAYADLKEQVAEVKRMLYRFMQSLSSTG
jgi:hypothetical protein